MVAFVALSLHPTEEGAFERLVGVLSLAFQPDAKLGICSFSDFSPLEHQLCEGKSLCFLTAAASASRIKPGP